MTQPAGHPTPACPIALTIAGSDSGGGAGIQADLKTFHRFGVFGTSVVVAVTAQNTRGVSAVHDVPAGVVQSQLAAVAEDLPPQAAKTGMLSRPELVDAVAEGIERFRFPNLVVDPVIVATSGDRLLSPEAERSIVERLVPLATLVTPNLHEARSLVGEPVNGVDDMERAARKLIAMGAGAALIKGGHLESGDGLVDVLVTAGETRHFRHPKLATSSTHGTGCTLSAAVAAGLARGADLVVAVEQAIDFVQRAIALAPGLGSGHGPLNHFVPARVSAG